MDVALLPLYAEIMAKLLVDRTVHKPRVGGVNSSVIVPPLHCTPSIAYFYFLWHTLLACNCLLLSVLSSASVIFPLEQVDARLRTQAYTTLLPKRRGYLQHVASWCDRDISELIQIT